MDSPFLKSPITNVMANMVIDKNLLEVARLDARVGRRGQIDARGRFRLLSSGQASGATVSTPKLDIKATGIEIRRNSNMKAYEGIFNATVGIEGDLTCPVVGGMLTFERGTIFLLPPSTASTTAESTTTAASAEAGRQEFLRSAFAALSAPRGLVSVSASTPGIIPSNTPVGPDSKEVVVLKGLRIRYANELRIHIISIVYS